MKKASTTSQQCNEVLYSMITDYQSPLLGYVGKLIGHNFDETQDIVQEVFLRAYRKMEKDGIESIDNTRCWLFRVAHNLAMDAGRKRGRQKKLREKAMNDPVLNTTLNSQNASAAEVVDKNELHTLARQTVDQLPTEQREIVLLKIMQGLTLKEIGSITGLKMGTVNYRLTQALRSLSQTLKELS